MPGNYKVGAFYLTGSERKFSGGHQQGDPGLYFLFDQMVYRKGGPKSDRGLTPFISLFFQPKNRNLFPFFMNGGLVYKGPFDKRPDDVATCGVAYGRYSSDLARVQSQRHETPQNAETVLEANYSIQITPWFYIMPDVQYIIHPKGRTTDPNALVLGAQIGLTQW
jgi:porin